MAPNRIPEFPYQLAEYLEQSRRTWMTSSVYLGGTSGSGGGAGGPPGGFVGQLVQSRIAYDSSELSIATTGSAPSILDNLNHIRYMITSGSFGGGGSGTLTGSGVTGQIAYWTSGSALGGDSLLTYAFGALSVGDGTGDGSITSDGEISSIFAMEGDDLSVGVQNTDGTDPFSNAVLYAITTGSGGGDPKTKWSVNGLSNWTAGIDNSDSDKFKIGASQTVGTSKVLEMSYTSGSIPGIGFLGSSAIARPVVTGSKVSGAALVSLLAGLVNLGLITDSTSA